MTPSNDMESPTTNERRKTGPVGFIDRNELIKTMFVEGQMTQSEIAVELGISRQRVQNILATKFNLTATPLREKQDKKDIDKIQTYISSNPAASTMDISAYTRLSKTRIKRLLQKGNIQRDLRLVRSAIATETRRHGRQPLTRTLLQQLYIEEGKTQSEIAESLGYRQTTISNRLRRFGMTNTPEKGA